MNDFHHRGDGLPDLEFLSGWVTTEEVFPICLFGEGTFHKYRDGAVTSNRTVWAKLDEEYASIFGKSYEAPRYSTILAGTFRTEAYKFHAESIQKMEFSFL